MKHDELENELYSNKSRTSICNNNKNSNKITEQTLLTPKMRDSTAQHNTINMKTLTPTNQLACV